MDRKTLLSEENLKRVAANKGTINDVVDKMGNTIFIVASKDLHKKNKKEEKLRFLLCNGSDINIPNFKGQTALTLAIEDYDADLVKFLLSYGAVVKAIDIFFTFFPPNDIAFLQNTLHILPTVNSHVQLNRNALDDILAEAVMHAIQRAVDGRTIYGSANKKVKPFMASIISLSGSQLDMFINSHFAKIVVKSSHKDTTTAFFEHKSVVDRMDSFALDFNHPIFLAIRFKNVVALRCIMKIAFINAELSCKFQPKCQFLISSVNLRGTICTYTPLSYLLLVFDVLDESHLDMLKLLLDANYPFENQKITMSPLSLYLVCIGRFGIRSNSTRITVGSLERCREFFAEKLPVLLARTSNLDQQAFKIGPHGTKKFNLELLKNDFKLPDALMIAFLSMNMTAVGSLLQYWHHSPAYLVMILGEIHLLKWRAPKLKEILAKIAFELLSFGLPNDQVHKFQTDKGVLKEPELQTRLKGRVCSLQHLAVYKIRESCKVQGSELPKVLAPLVPQGLQSLLLLQPSEEVVNKLEKLAREYQDVRNKPHCTSYYGLDDFGEDSVDDYSEEFSNSEDEYDDDSQDSSNSSGSEGVIYDLDSDDFNHDY